MSTVPPAPIVASARVSHLVPVTLCETVFPAAITVPTVPVAVTVAVEYDSAILATPTSAQHPSWLVPVASSGSNALCTSSASSQASAHGRRQAPRKVSRTGKRSRSIDVGKYPEFSSSVFTSSRMSSRRFLTKPVAVSP